MSIDIKSMGYVRVASTDLAQWETFAGKVLGLAKGRQKGDKRQAIAERDSKREIERALGRQRKGIQ